jgi:mxaL protein
MRRAAPGTWPWLGAALALLIAWADPQWPQTQPRWEHVVIVDITQSMNTRDMQVPVVGAAPAATAADSRLAFVRHALQRAVSDLPCGSTLGLGVFTEYRSLLLLAPLEVCSHYDELLAVIGRIDGRMAWASSSEVARGVESALQVTLRASKDAASAPSLVFISDGHESPPLRGGALPTIELPQQQQPPAGWIAGVGGDEPMPIPKFDPTGRALGFWRADEVMQTDPVSLGRTVGGAVQTLVDADGKPVEVFRASGLEHLSSLKEPHLRAVAQATGLQYQRLVGAGDLSAMMRAPALARPVQATTSWRWLPALAALLLLARPFLPRRTPSDSQRKADPP